VRAHAAFISILLSGAWAWGQPVISAHSGTVHYIEGEVTLNGQAVHPKFGEFPEIKNDQVLATGEGRAEVLLTPGVFLRLAENSSVRMISNALSDTRLEVVSGSALIEAGELLEHNAIVLQAAGVPMEIKKKGLYRIDAEPPRLRVYDGQIAVNGGKGEITVKKGRELDLAAPAAGGKVEAQKFDSKQTDAFYRWGERRADYIAAANVASARVAANSAYAGGYAGGAGMWSFNPWFGMYTYLPASGIYWSPFGYPFYSPIVMSMGYVPYMSPRFGGANTLGGVAVAPTPSRGVSPGVMRGPEVAAPAGPAFSGGGPAVGFGGAAPAPRIGTGAGHAGGGVGRAAAGPRGR
jgi:hypothetical protein